MKNLEKFIRPLTEIYARMVAVLALTRDVEIKRVVFIPVQWKNRLCLSKFATFLVKSEYSARSWLGETLSIVQF